MIRKIVLVGFSFLLIQACTNDPNKLPPEQPYTGPTLVSKNLHVVITDSGKVRKIMESPLQQRFANDDEVFPKGLEMKFFEGDSILTTFIKADSGYFHHDKNYWTISGNVVVDNAKDHRKLESDLINWDVEQKKVWTDEKVKITTQDQRIEGVGMNAADDFSDYEIHFVTGTFAL